MCNRCRYARVADLEKAIADRSVDWTQPWVLSDTAAAQEVFAKDPMKSTLQDFLKNFPGSPSAQSGSRRAQTILMTGMGLEQVRPLLSGWSPLEQDTASGIRPCV